MMNFLFGLILFASPVNHAADTLRYDGYYLKVDDQATRWHLLYFSPNGRFIDTSNTGTPPLFEEGSLSVREDHRFTITREKKDYLMKLEVVSDGLTESSGAIQYKCVFEEDQFIVVETRDSKGKWKKTRERYYFIPY